MTYPEVSEIRTEWAPEQVALTESERKAHEVQQQRVGFWRERKEALDELQQAHDEAREEELFYDGEGGTLTRRAFRKRFGYEPGAVRPIPTVCPKR